MDSATAPVFQTTQIHYERRRPEETVLYRIVQENVETFLAQVEMETGQSLPEFVTKEFEDYLRCGILAHGFVRAKCEDCKHDKLIAFSWPLLRVPAFAALVHPCTSRLLSELWCEAHGIDGCSLSGGGDSQGPRETMGAVITDPIALLTGVASRAAQSGIECRKSSDFWLSD